MVILRAFQIINQDGNKMISYIYNILNDSGDIVKKNQSDSFYAIDSTLLSHIDAIENFIKTERLQSKQGGSE